MFENWQEGSQWQRDLHYNRENTMGNSPAWKRTKILLLLRQSEVRDIPWRMKGKMRTWWFCFSVNNEQGSVQPESEEGELQGTDFISSKNILCN